MLSATVRRVRASPSTLETGVIGALAYIQTRGAFKTAAARANDTKKRVKGEDEGEGVGTVSGEQKRKVRAWLEDILTKKVPEVVLTEEQKKAEKDFLRDVQAKMNVRSARRDFLEGRKIRVKLNAIEALPSALREEALKPDENPWPLSILPMCHSPPSKESVYSHYRMNGDDEELRERMK